MGDPNDKEDDVAQGTYVFPLPPDEGWLGRFPARVKAIVTTAEFAGALTFAGIAWSVGSDVTLTAIALFVGWILGSVGIATVPNKSGGWRVAAVIILFLVFALEGGFLYWHFHAGQPRRNPAAWQSFSADVRSRLAMALKALPAQRIVIACETINCKALSDDFVAAFLAAGWQAKSLHGDGLDIIGRTGIWINPDEEITNRIKLAIEGTTGLKVNVGPDTLKNYGSGPIFLVVGTKPF